MCGPLISIIDDNESTLQALARPLRSFGIETKTDSAAEEFMLSGCAEPNPAAFNFRESHSPVASSQPLSAKRQTKTRAGQASRARKPQRTQQRPGGRCPWNHR
jgi:hypothetical protein